MKQHRYQFLLSESFYLLNLSGVRLRLNQVIVVYVKKDHQNKSHLFNLFFSWKEQIHSSFFSTCPHIKINATKFCFIWYLELSTLLGRWVLIWNNIFNILKAHNLTCYVLWNNASSSNFFQKINAKNKKLITKVFH